MFRSTYSEDRAARKCEKNQRPIVVALQEVQIRLRLDENYIIYSLDGLVDHKIEEFIDQKNCIDHFEYLRSRRVRIVLEFHEFIPRDSNCGITLHDVGIELTKNRIFEYKNIRFHGFKWRGSTRAWVEYM